MNGNANANANADADAKVTTIALPVLCTGELKMIGLTPCVFSTKVDIHDIQVKLCLFYV